MRASRTTSSDAPRARSLALGAMLALSAATRPTAAEPPAPNPDEPKPSSPTAPAAPASPGNPTDPANPAAPTTPADGAKPATPSAPPATVPGPRDVVSVQPQKDLPVEELVFFGETWKCELCLTPESRSIGMGARTDFPAGTAMVFVHPRPELLSFWMKDCLIDLDIVFVDAEGRISAIHEAKREKLRTVGESRLVYERRLKRYTSNRLVRFALEFPAGTVARLKPTLGQKIDIDWARLAARAH